MIPPTYTTQEDRFDINHTLTTLRGMLPDIACDLIASRHDSSNHLQQKFSINPDSPAEHSPLWHQYGILTHAEEFQKILQFHMPILMEQWKVFNLAEAALSESIQGISKKDLLLVAALLHDLGKFTSRTFERQEDGTSLAKFVGHEVDSGIIVRGTLKDVLQKLGLQDQHIEYIAQCTEHHFDLGKARQIATDSGGYTMAYARSESFKDVARGIMRTTPKLVLEIGLMFIADSLSKTTIMATATTDEAIEAQRPTLEREIMQKGLDSRLINQALQQPVNVEIGKQYLLLWADAQAA